MVKLSGLDFARDLPEVAAMLRDYPDGDYPCLAMAEARERARPRRELELEAHLRTSQDAGARKVAEMLTKLENEVVSLKARIDKLEGRV